MGVQRFKLFFDFFLFLYTGFSYKSCLSELGQKEKKAETEEEVKDCKNTRGYAFVSLLSYYQLQKKIEMRLFICHQYPPWCSSSSTVYCAQQLYNIFTCLWLISFAFYMIIFAFAFSIFLLQMTPHRISSHRMYTEKVKVSEGWQWQIPVHNNIFTSFCIAEGIKLLFDMRLHKFYA